MTRALAASALALRLLAGCASEGPPRTFADSDLVLAVGNGARFGCTCLFVMKMPEAYCREWIKASPDVATVAIDTAGKAVVSTAFVAWSARAHFVNDKVGCVLE